MKTIYFNKNSHPVIVDTDKDTAKQMSRGEFNKYRFDDIYFIEEDCEIRYKNKTGNTIVKKVNKGDFIMSFSNSDCPNEVAVLKSSDLKENAVHILKSIAADRAADTVTSQYEAYCCGSRA